MPQDFAPGLPDKHDPGNIQRLPVDTVLTLVRQLHRAKRAGDHVDLRIGDPAGLESFAMPKDLPVGDEARLAIPQPVHRWSYKDFQGRLGHGYGEGTVEKLEESPVVLLKNSPNHILFTRGDSKTAPVYSMVRTKNGNWLVSIRKPNQPLEIRQYSKEHFKFVPMSKALEMIADGAEATKKIDGAGALLYLGKHGMGLYGINDTKSGLKPDYGQHMSYALQGNVPEGLEGTVVRGELYGERNGESIPPQELSGILNSTVQKSVWKRKGDGIRLMLAALAVNRNGVDDYDPKAVGAVVKALDNPYIHAMQRLSGDDARLAIEGMRNGTDKLTHEGVVLHMPGKRPVKAKFLDDSDVVVREIFPAVTKDGDVRAGGFKYSLPGSDAIVGNVGTGMDHALLKDMLANPDNYIGRTARIQSMGQHSSGAYRQPVFLAMKED